MEFDEQKTFDVNDEDDDPVVAEMPVFLSQKAADYLCLVQYPLRKAHRPLHGDKVESYTTPYAHTKIRNFHRNFSQFLTIVLVTQNCNK